MKKAYIFLATGFEETEVVATVDTLLRGGVNAIMVSLTSQVIVKGAHDIELFADTLFDFQPDFDDAAALILPGGDLASQLLNEDSALKDLLLRHANRPTLIAAICAAPLVLGGLGLLNGLKATCYPGIEPQLTGATIITDRPVVLDSHYLTSRGPGTVFAFALAILAYLEGQELSDAVASEIIAI
jgi:4-methyl-5(b-hydroxyethyl)-thiazole monophosphate biosynthesis